MAEITVKAWDKEIKITIPDDSHIEEWVDVFRTILLHLSFDINLIEDYLPTDDQLLERIEEYYDTNGDYDAGI